jgi:aerobic-type carbon monoxide dehydrogenase small subunit (CoxS/CutS family)
MEFTLNGEAMSVEVREGASLLELLREGCEITSV